MYWSEPQYAVSEWHDYSGVGGGGRVGVTLTLNPPPSTPYSPTAYPLLPTL